MSQRKASSQIALLLDICFSRLCLCLIVLISMIVSQTAMLDNALGGALSEAAEGVKAAIPRGIFGHPLDHARAVVYLASDDAQWLTAITLNVDGGLAAQ